MTDDMIDDGRIVFNLFFHDPNKLRILRIFFCMNYTSATRPHDVRELSQNHLISS